VSDEKIKLDM